MLLSVFPNQEVQLSTSSDRMKSRGQQRAGLGVCRIGIAGVAAAVRRLGAAVEEEEEEDASDRDDPVALCATVLSRLCV